MQDFYVAFTPASANAIARTQEFFALIKAAKEGGDTADPALAASLDAWLTETERAYFSRPTPAELECCARDWKATPVAQRASPAVSAPGCDFEPMLDAFWNGEYQLPEITKSDSEWRFTFNPYAYPFGGTGAAWWPCLSVLGIRLWAWKMVAARLLGNSRGGGR